MIHPLTLLQKMKQVLFEGKTIIADRIVDIKIYKVDGYYEWDYNPHLKDKSQIDFHIGEIMRAQSFRRAIFPYQAI